MSIKKYVNEYWYMSENVSEYMSEGTCVCVCVIHTWVRLKLQVHRMRSLQKELN